MKKILVGKTGDGGKLYFVVGGKTDGIYQVKNKLTEVSFWDFVDKRPDLEELTMTKTQKMLWSRNISNAEWVSRFMPPQWRVSHLFLFCNQWTYQPIKTKPFAKKSVRICA